MPDCATEPKQAPPTPRLSAKSLQVVAAITIMVGIISIPVFSDNAPASLMLWCVWAVLVGLFAWVMCRVFADTGRYAVFGSTGLFLFAVLLALPSRRWFVESWWADFVLSITVIVASCVHSPAYLGGQFLRRLVIWLAGAGILLESMTLLGFLSSFFSVGSAFLCAALSHMCILSVLVLAFLSALLPSKAKGLVRASWSGAKCAFVGIPALLVVMHLQRHLFESHPPDVPGFLEQVFGYVLPLVGSAYLATTGLGRVFTEAQLAILPSRARQQDDAAPPLPQGSTSPPHTGLQPIPVRLYVIAYAVLSCCFVILAVGALGEWIDGNLALGSLAAVLFIVIAIVAAQVVLVARFLHHCWSLVQREGVRATPQDAVAYLFVPFYGAYWIFQAFWGLTRDLNRIIRSRNMGLPQAPEGVAVAVCMFSLMVPIALPCFPVFSEHEYSVLALSASLNMGHLVFALLFLSSTASIVNAVAAFPSPEGSEEARTVNGKAMVAESETIAVKCQCGKSLRAKRTAAGKQGRCPYCGTVISIP